MADLKWTSVTMTVPTDGFTGEGFAISGLSAVLHNNGPSTTSADFTVTLLGPSDCLVNGSIPLPLIVRSSGINDLPPSSSQDVLLNDAPIPVTCSEPSFHQFELVAETQPAGGTVDPNPDNDMASTTGTAAITGFADVKVTSVTVDADATAAVGGAFDVTAQMVGHNNGPVTPATADASLTLNLPSGCTTGDTNPATENGLSLALSVPSPSPEITWSVTCDSTGQKDFTATGSLTLAPVLHLSDSNTSNDSMESSLDSTTITGAADLKVSAVAVSAPTGIDAGQNFIVSVSGTIHNNGPEATTYSETIDLSVPPDCTAIVAQDIVVPAGLEPSVPVPVSQAWQVNCSDPSTHQFDGSVSVAVTDPDLSDPNTTNNSGNNHDLTAITAEADVEITSVSVDAPTSAPAGTPFPVTIMATVQNNGPVTPVDVEVTLNPASLPDDCGAPEPGDLTQIVTDLAQGSPEIVQSTLQVTCDDPSFHVFDATASVSVIELHVTDPIANNNSKLSSGPDSTAVIGQADLQIGLTAGSAPRSADAGVPFNVSVQSFATSVGPMTTEAQATIDLTLPPDCRYDADPPFPHVKTVTVTPFNTVSPSPTLTASVVCDNPSNHDFVFNASIVPTTLHIEDSNGANDTDEKTATTAVLAETDLKVNAVTVTPSSPDVATGIPFDVTVKATVHNNGPVSLGAAGAEIDLDLAVGANCSKTPDDNHTEMFALPISSSMDKSFTWSVTCTVEEDGVPLTGSAAISTSQLHVSDSNSENNDGDDENSVDVTQPKETDLKITALDVLAPAEAAPGESFLVSVIAIVHNNGPASQVLAIVEHDLGIPNDCIAQSVLTLVIEGDILLDMSVAYETIKTWEVVCSDTSFHNFAGFARAFITSEGLIDTNLDNNSGLPKEVTTKIIADADLKISSVSIEMPSDAAAGEAFDVDVTAVVHNNGPFTPADANVVLDLDLPAGCSATTPGTAEFSASLALSVADPINHSWSVTCDAPGIFEIGVDATIVSTDRHQTDNNDENNSGRDDGTVTIPTPPVLPDPPTTAPPTTPPETTPPTEPPTVTPTPTPTPTEPPTETPEPTTPPTTEPPEPTPTPSPVVLPETATPEPSPDASPDASPTPAVFPPTGGEPLSTNGFALGLLLLLGGVLVAGGAWIAWRNQNLV